MNYVGFDPSTKTGAVLLDADGNLLDAKTIRFPETKGFRRLQLIAKAVNSTIADWKPEIVVVEGLGFANKFTFVECVQTGTIVRQALYNAGIGWYEVSPTSVKKWTTGSGKAKKPEMAKAVLERWNFKSKSDDIVDAYAMAQIARHIHLSGGSNLTGVIYEEPAVS